MLSLYFLSLLFLSGYTQLYAVRAMQQTMYHRELLLHLKFSFNESIACYESSSENTLQSKMIFDRQSRYSSDEYLPHMYNVQIIVGSFQKTALSSINNNNNNSDDGNSSRIRKCFSICVGRQNTAPMHAITGLNFVCQFFSLFSLCFSFSSAWCLKKATLFQCHICVTRTSSNTQFFLFSVIIIYWTKIKRENSCQKILEYVYGNSVERNQLMTLLTYRVFRTPVGNNYCAHCIENNQKYSTKYIIEWQKSPVFDSLKIDISISHVMIHVYVIAQNRINSC